MPAGAVSAVAYASRAERPPPTGTDAARLVHPVVALGPPNGAGAGLRSGTVSPRSGALALGVRDIALRTLDRVSVASSV
jgi:hypothetical protein